MMQKGSITATRSSPHRPFAAGQALLWHLREKLDLERMRRGAAFFVGEHDFAAFRTSGCAAKTTIRRIDSVKFTAENSLLSYRCLRLRFHAEHGEDHGRYAGRDRSGQNAAGTCEEMSD